MRIMSSFFWNSFPFAFAEKASDPPVIILTLSLVSPPFIFILLCTSRVTILVCNQVIDGEKTAAVNATT